MLSEDCTIAEVKEKFAADRFATEACRAKVLEARKGYARCMFEITPLHFNAAGSVMGGAIFTLADFALAIACNIGEEPTVSVSNTIEFLSSTKGSQLFAECKLDKSGRTLGFYSVTVTDDLGKTIALMSAVCHR